MALDSGFPAGMTGVALDSGFPAGMTGVALDSGFPAEMTAVVAVMTGEGAGMTAGIGWAWRAAKMTSA